MRTAVVRVNVDPSGMLTSAQLGQGITALRKLAGDAGADLLDNDLEATASTRREVQLLIAGSDGDAVQKIAVELCRRAFRVFGTAQVAGVITYISRGTDDDAHGVLAGFGLTGQIRRVPDADGFDVVHVTLRESDLERVPESRIHTALEASLNCEVRIVTC
ncbi:MAG: hypothetical protein WA317_22460 [Mycobacterium sp.]|uniref:hypothetical protein n=1 Tax=Mycobacterium sp. TaxID=1785 RepID=UPI003CC60B6F